MAIFPAIRGRHQTIFSIPTCNHDRLPKFTLDFVPKPSKVNILDSVFKLLLRNSLCLIDYLKKLNLFNKMKVHIISSHDRS